MKTFLAKPKALQLLINRVRRQQSRYIYPLFESVFCVTVFRKNVAWQKTRGAGEDLASSTGRGTDFPWGGA
jgi:hypothetical protein